MIYNFVVIIMARAGLQDKKWNSFLSNFQVEISFFLIFSTLNAKPFKLYSSDPPPDIFQLVQFSSVTQLYPTLSDPMDYIACQASLSITNSRGLPKLMSIESVMPSNHLILWQLS